MSAELTSKTFNSRGMEEVGKWWVGGGQEGGRGVPFATLFANAARKLVSDQGPLLGTVFIHEPYDFAILLQQERNRVKSHPQQQDGWMGRQRGEGERQTERGERDLLCPGSLHKLGVQNLLPPESLVCESGWAVCPWLS